MGKTTIRAFDCNGREIHVGDRVKIRGDETAKFINDWFDEDWAEYLLRNNEDCFGVVVDDDFLQIVNENGDMLYDLSTNFEEPDPCLEIVESGYQECSTATLSLKRQDTSASNVAKDPLISWFGEKMGQQMLQDLHKEYPAPPKCVYVLLMKNGTVKIGVTQNFEKRMNTISTSSGLEVVQWCHTEYLPKRKAYSIENACHSVFASRRIKGEFFDVPYETACIELAKHASVVD